MTDHLFVYGTLLSTADHPMGRRLRREARLVGPATFRGRLYRVDWYPGVIDGDDGDVVHGELYRLADPESAFVWLDEFEGVTRGASSVTDPDAYVRAERAVTRTHAAIETVAWIYLYRGTPTRHSLQVEGRWRG
jgi:gamma-glutamylcyclotransferase (GGCT)/AIG2-like uncharacterized protein YtfP